MPAGTVGWLFALTALNEGSQTDLIRTVRSAGYALDAEPA